MAAVITTPPATAEEIDWALGPGAVAWDVLANPGVYIVGLLREAMLLTLHPKFAAAAADHETIHSDPIGRYRKVSRFFYANAYGTKKEAALAASFVRRRHTQITGTEPMSGEYYQAHAEYELVLTHNLLTDSMLAVHEAAGGRIPDARRDQFVREHRLEGALLGIRAELMPNSYAELQAWLAEARTKFAAGEQARTILAPFATGAYPADSKFRELKPWQYWLAGHAVRLLTDMALDTMHASDRHLLAIDRPRVLRSKRLTRLAFKGLLRFMETERGLGYFDWLLKADIAKIYKRGMAHHAPGTPFDPPDAAEYVVEIDDLIHNMPAT